MRYVSSVIEWCASKLHNRPTTLLTYVNNLLDWILSSIQMFADDTKLTVTGNSLQVRTFDVVYSPMRFDVVISQTADNAAATKARVHDNYKIVVCRVAYCFSP